MLEMPSCAKSITLEAIPPNTEAIMPLLCLWSFGYASNFKAISFVNISYAVNYNNVFVSDNILHMVQFSDNRPKA